MPLQQERVHGLLYEAAETELGGVQVYETALRCARNGDLRKEWTKYLKQTRRHVEITQSLLDDFGLERDKETPGRAIVRGIGESLVEAMGRALAAGDPAAAEVVAAECVVLAETKDHLNWKLLSECAKKLDGEKRRALKDAVDEVEEEEDEHFYHTAGWTRELWLEGLGVGGVLPPPEEEKDVKSAIGAARAEQSRRGPRSRAKPRAKPLGKRRHAASPKPRGRKAAAGR